MYRLRATLVLDSTDIEETLIEVGFTETLHPPSASEADLCVATEPVLDRLIELLRQGGHDQLSQLEVALRAADERVDASARNALAAVAEQIISYGDDEIAGGVLINNIAEILKTARKHNII